MKSPQANAAAESLGGIDQAIGRRTQRADGRDDLPYVGYCRCVRHFKSPLIESDFRLPKREPPILLIVAYIIYIYNMVIFRDYNGAC
jgi:hypothetical protein